MGKNILTTMAEFSKKLERFEKADDSARNTGTENDVLQKIINLSEEERKNYLLKEYGDFENPMSLEVEEDENSLLEAYDIFLQLLEIQKKSKYCKLADLTVECGICKKAEYTDENTNGGKFCFLRCWFLSTKPDAEFVPEITKNKSGKYGLTFTDKALWKMSRLEKEIFQAVGTIYT